MQDPTSDMAVVSKKGSGIVKFRREQKERRKAQKKEWELAGTRLGNLLGVANEERRDDAPLTESGELDLRAAHTFADKLPVSRRKRGAGDAGGGGGDDDDDSGASDFTTNKTLLEQRRSLPVFASRQAVRAALLSCIRSQVHIDVLYIATCFSLHLRAAAATDS